MAAFRGPDLRAGIEAVLRRLRNLRDSFLASEKSDNPPDDPSDGTGIGLAPTVDAGGAFTAFVPRPAEEIANPPGNPAPASPPPSGSFPAPPDAGEPAGDRTAEPRRPVIRETLERLASIRSAARARAQSARTTDEAEGDAGIREALARISVVAFIGPSGTGKSTRALAVAHREQIHHIIDDGLLIHGGRIVAGLSAKRAASRLESVRQALFVDDSRSRGMRRSLVAAGPQVLMVLGTSDAMVDKICENLWLPAPARRIRIEEVSSEDEIRMAMHTRQREGKHTIPVPSMEIKHEFSGYFSDPLHRLRARRARDRGGPLPAETERTVVRPTFSGLGRYSISDEAMRDMTRLVLRKVRGVADLTGFEIHPQAYGVDLSAELCLYYGANAQQVLREVQQRLIHDIEELTAINVLSVSVRARKVVHAPTAQGSPVGSSGRPSRRTDAG